MSDEPLHDFIKSHGPSQPDDKRLLASYFVLRHKPRRRLPFEDLACLDIRLTFWCCLRALLEARRAFPTTQRELPSVLAQVHGELFSGLPTNHLLDELIYQAKLGGGTSSNLRGVIQMLRAGDYRSILCTVNGSWQMGYMLAELRAGGPRKSLEAWEITSLRRSFARSILAYPDAVADLSRIR